MVQQQLAKDIKRRRASSLTPNQLARKRANDRNAQRAIRVRTKEYIERLEKELEELKSRHSHNEIVQELVQKNRALEMELATLKEGLSLQSCSYPQLAACGKDIFSHESSAFTQESLFDQNIITAKYDTQFEESHLPEEQGLWASVGGRAHEPHLLPAVLSPHSSAYYTDEHLLGYNHSMPSSTMEITATTPSTVPYLEESSQSGVQTVPPDTTFSSLAPSLELLPSSKGL
ncbi:hypothetical protein F5883DRAFT_584767 [Diaporthe sp. PMI_573]|nr:hypothetical protein F5883DRAFT_584767 [Diaporthaceae sp. PMI_573]